MPVRPDWRRFDELDCEAFAGATPFANGDEPWIAVIEVDGESALAVVDAAGVSVIVGAEQDESWSARDGNAIVGLPARTSRVELERLGFRSPKREPSPAEPMVRVQFKRFSQPDLAPTWIDGAAHAVPAEPFADVDEGQGGITFVDITDDAMVAPLMTFSVGAEVYVESDDPHEALDDETEESEARTHIWWRATVLEP